MVNASEEDNLEIRVIILPFWLYFVAITSAELLTALLQPLVGVISHSIILIALFSQAAFASEPKRRNLIIALSLVPLVRIISLSMPLAKVPFLYWYILIYTPLFAAAVVVMSIIRLKPGEVGLVTHGLFLQIAVGVITGFAFGTIEYFILRPEPLIAELSLKQIWFPAIVLILTTGFVEELIFRGILQQTSEAVMGRMGLIYISAIFATLHTGHLSIIDVIFVFLIALFFATWVKRTGSLIGATLSHGFTNVFLYLIVPFILA